MNYAVWVLSQLAGCSVRQKTDACSFGSLIAIGKPRTIPVSSFQNLSETGRKCNHIWNNVPYSKQQNTHLLTLRLSDICRYPESVYLHLQRALRCYSSLYCTPNCLVSCTVGVHSMVINETTREDNAKGALGWNR